jgi:hypothetical protein
MAMLALANRSRIFRYFLPATSMISFRAECDQGRAALIVRFVTLGGLDIAVNAAECVGVHRLHRAGTVENEADVGCVHGGHLSNALGCCADERANNTRDPKS